MRRSQEAQLAQAKRYEETNRKLETEIKGWNADLAGKLRQYAADMGVSENVVRVLAHDVGAVKALHEAYLGRQLIEKQKAAAKAATTVDPKPLAKVGGQGVRNAVDLFRVAKSDDVSSYVAARQKQMAHR
jgi:Zn-dependent peptidase ImmA (M78 family)